MLSLTFLQDPQPGSPCLPTGPPHHRLRLFVFMCLCLSATLHLSGLCPRVHWFGRLPHCFKLFPPLSCINWLAAIMSSRGEENQSLTFFLCIVIHLESCNVWQASNIKDDMILYFCFCLLLDELRERSLSRTLKWGELQLEARCAPTVINGLSWFKYCK